MSAAIHEAARNFRPTSESIPPPNPIYRLRLPKDIPVNHTPLTPLAFLLRAALIHPHKLALAHPDVAQPVYYSFAVWAQRIQNLAYALLKAGIKPGDRVAVIAPNSPLIADAHNGVLAARAVICPINTRLTKHEVEYILEHSGSKLILADHEYVHLVKDAKIPVIVSNDTGRVGDPYETFLSEGRRYSAERGWEGLDIVSDENDNATLCYTSGTTGRPKGVMSTHRGSYLAAIANALEGRLSGKSVYLWILPMFHASGWTYPWSNIFTFSLQITTRNVHIPTIWKHLIESGVTHYCGAPTVQIGIVSDELARRLPKPIYAIVAGSAPTAHLIGELEKKNIRVVHVYGLTETYGPFTRNYAQTSHLTFDERTKVMARQGHSFATADEARVVHRDKNGDLADVPMDGQTVGEIVTRGNIVMKEYFRDEEATKKAFEGGHFATGDLAVRHPDGSVAIQDRSKDIIISGGENASSLAIEQELATFEPVLEVSVVARAHPKWGERPMAFVILRPHLRKDWEGRHVEFAAALKEHARTRLPGFACPEWVQVVPELPKTSTGKIKKHDLRKIVAKL